MTLNSGLSISVVQCDVLQSAQNVIRMMATRSIQLVMASGDQLPSPQYVKDWVS